MLIVDLIIAVFLVLALYKGFKKGLVNSLISLVALLIGVFIALRFSFYANNVLSSNTTWNPTTIKISAFIVTFLLVLIGLHFLGKVITKLIGILALGLVNKLGGAFFELLKVLMIISVFISVFNTLNYNSFLASEEKLQTSIFYKDLDKFSKIIYPSLKNLFLEEYLDRI